MRSIPKIYHGKVNNHFFVISVFDDEHITHPMMLGLKKFFEYWNKQQLQILEKEKRKRELNHGYLSVSSGSSSGFRRK